MKQQPTSHRRVAALLFAAAALPFTPVLAQDTAQPPIVTPPPPPVSATPPPSAMSPPRPVGVAPPSPVTTTEPDAPAQTSAARSERVARPAPAPRARVIRAAAAEPATPVAAAAEPAPAAPAADPATFASPSTAIPVESEAAVPVTDDSIAADGGGASWLWIAAIGVALLAGLFAFMFVRRRRVVEETEFQDEPVVAAAPVAPTIEPQPYVAPYVAPAMTREPPADAVGVAPPATEAEVAGGGAAERTPAVETRSVGEPDAADVAAMAAASQPEANRPWLEMLMRPLRAGTTSEDARVEFELTVGNTGSVAAEDVRISTWMFPAGTERASEMERLLIDSEQTIDPGDGTRVEAAIALPKAGLTESVLPVVVADARYRLPDGSERRTRAAFAVGLPEGEDLAPFPIDRSSGLLESVEARLHGDLERD